MSRSRGFFVLDEYHSGKMALVSVADLSRDASPIRQRFIAKHWLHIEALAGSAEAA